MPKPRAFASCRPEGAERPKDLAQVLRQKAEILRYAQNDMGRLRMTKGNVILRERSDPKDLAQVLRQKAEILRYAQNDKGKCHPERAERPKDLASDLEILR